MPASTKKRPPLEMEPGEGKAHEMSESSSEEVREGSEADEKQSSRSRKRSAKGSKNTKAPMDTEGGCCNEKKGKGKCPTCAAGGACRGDAALTPHEYLAACELGIQDRSRTYIRARLDTIERLDKKCGSSGIPDNAKCSKQTSSANETPTIAKLYGQAVSGFLTGSNILGATQNLKTAFETGSAGAAIAGVGNVLGAGLNAKAFQEHGKGNSAKGALYSLGGSAAAATGYAVGAPMHAEHMFKKAAKESSKRANAYKGTDPYADLGLPKNATAAQVRKAYMEIAKREHPDAGGNADAYRKATEAYTELKRRMGRKDSVWAYGLEP